MTTIEFQTIDRNLLDATTGGDFASKYVNNLKQDGLDFWHRAQATASDLKSHKWGSAAKNFGGELLDEVGTVGDAIAPIKALK
ncbi:MAG TPA: hypothetical protein VHW23_03825 [Kofleriaceae bacterium]|jgi:hypothetical protein|nr:hypothetical protein [Kofleriaceae bacterium]